MFRTSLRRTINALDFPEKASCLGEPKPHQSAESFPHFVICVSQEQCAENFQKVRWVLHQLSDNLFFPTPGLIVADLRNMQSHFKNTERLTQTLQKACEQSFPCAQQESDQNRFFLGQHFFKSLLFSQNESLGHIHLLNASNLKLRLLGRDLSWEAWLQCALFYLNLYAFPAATLQTHADALKRFVQSMEHMRFPKPETARAQWSFEELNRRFGRVVATLWKSCYHSCPFHSFAHVPLRHQDAPLEPAAFSASSLETPTFSITHAIDLSALVPCLLECITVCFEKLRQASPLIRYGVRHFEVTIQFASGHTLKKQIFLNETIFEIDRTTETILSQIFERLLSPAQQRKGQRFQEDQNSQSIPNFFARVTASGGGEADTENWQCVSTSDGLGLCHPKEPEVAHLVGHIAFLSLCPLRIAPEAHRPEHTQLFESKHKSMDLNAIFQLRKELLALDGHSSQHFTPQASFKRPHAARPLFPQQPLPPSSRLYSHAFLHRPPAVLRCPLPFFFPHEPESPPKSNNCFYLESVGNYDFYLWASPRVAADTALWLCSPSSERHKDLQKRKWQLMGYFDSLQPLPEWIVGEMKRASCIKTQSRL